MAIATKTINHDYLILRAIFPDGQKLRVSWSRGGGENVFLNPPAKEHAERLSLIVAENLRLNGKLDYPFRTLGEAVGAMEASAKAAADVGGFLDDLCRVLRVSGERPQPKLSRGAPASTRVDMKESRGGWQINARFPNGESFELKLNRSSVSWAADPAIASRDREVINFLFGVKQMGIYSNDEAAALIKEKAETAGSFDDWFEDLRAACSPRPRP